MVSFNTKLNRCYNQTLCLKLPTSISVILVTIIKLRLIVISINSH
jgi:hypothetical protein